MARPRASVLTPDEKHAENSETVNTRMVYGTGPKATLRGCQRMDVVAAYALAKEVVVQAGYEPEIVWQASVIFDETTETDFLREHAWVTISAGMHEYVVRRHFPAISRAFLDWKSADAIVEHEAECRQSALRYFCNHRKIDSIVRMARIVSSAGIGSFKESNRDNPLETLQSLPFVGPVTCYHLAKNIGLPFAKPDRHLVRLARAVGYSDVQGLCKRISEHVGDSVPVVDIVLWRFSLINSAYCDVFSSAALSNCRNGARRRQRTVETRASVAEAKPPRDLNWSIGCV